MGIKSGGTHLKEQGFRNRRGQPFRIQKIQELLRRTAYVGRCYFNRVDSHSRKPKSHNEWVEVPVPAIVDEELFDATQRLLDARHPSRTPPRVVNSPTL